MSQYKFASVFAPYMQGLIDLKRGLGYKYQEITPYRVFDYYAVEHDIQTPELTREICDGWGEQRLNESPVTRVGRIVAIRNLSKYMSSLGLPAYLPRLPGNCKSTFTPYIFTNDEIKNFFEACDKLTVKNISVTYPLYPALYRLLYGTGMRISEAFGLLRRDVNLAEGIITLRNTKNGDERLLPLSETLRGVLEQYDSTDYVRKEPDAFFFTKKTGEPMTKKNTSWVFHKLLREIGVSYKGREYGPRVHDFRHTFAVHSLAKMAESGLDLYYALPILSKYIGHKAMESTEQYVRLTEEMFPTVLEKANKICACVFPEIKGVLSR